MNNDDYLWDGSGTPDPEVERLEQLLGRYRHRGAAPELPRRITTFPRVPAGMLGSAFPMRAGIAATVLVAASLWLAMRTPYSTWEVTRLEGRPMVGSNAIAGTGRLGVGQWLVTDSGSRAKMDIGVIGEVEVDSNSRMQLVKARPTEHRVSLERGRIHARIWAPPRLFFVETPSAVAVDLGCSYTLEVGPGGESLVRTTLGWVGFEWKGRESWVPAGAACATRPGIGPGTPYFEDASDAFRSALALLDFGSPGPAERTAAFETVLSGAREQDALTLWHLLSRVHVAERERVYDRLVALVPAPQGVSRDGVLKGDRRMLDSWWDALGFGESSWWRLWKGPYPSR